MDELKVSLSKIPGIRTYTDEQGRFHVTTKTLEQELKEKEEKLELEFGKICDNCHSRNKWPREDLDGLNLCEYCYNKIWEEKSSNGGEISFRTSCPFCSKELILIDEEGKCDCGAYYSGGFLDEFYYGYHFYKRRC
jgi:hypothetical protein